VNVSLGRCEAADRPRENMRVPGRRWTTVDATTATGIHDEVAPHVVLTAATTAQLPTQ